jgi:biopolymer transport protein ExbD
MRTEAATENGGRKPVPAVRSSVSRVSVIRRLRGRGREDEDVEVDLSPLIDCVFLLLIFFLVTTMMKKLEKRIPVTLPDYTAVLAPAAEAATVIYSLEEDGDLHRASATSRTMQGLNYRPVGDFAADLKTVAENLGTGVQIRIDTERDVSVQRVIDVLDTLAIQGFEKVGVRLRHREKEFFELEDYRP